MMGLVHRNAQPFFWEGEKGVFCLLIHGFTGSPGDMRVLGEYLKERGYGVSCILLPGHGTSPEDMKETAWPDWYGAVEKEYLRITKEYNDAKIVPMGLSMGGMLALHLASLQRVPGVVTFSAPVFFADANTYNAAGLLKPFVSLLQLMEIVKEELAGIDVPALIIQSQDDRTVKPESAEYLYENLGSKNKKLIWLKKSGHVITLGMERCQVFQAVEEFINIICAAEGGGHNAI